MGNSSDRELWVAVVTAERELARCRGEFYQHARSRPQVLGAALRGQNWEVAAALHFLSMLPADSLELLPQMVQLALSDRWALYARRAIDRAPRDRLHPALNDIILPRLSSADEDEYRRFAELLSHVEAWDLLPQLTQRALASDDPYTREVAEDFIEWYGPMWGARREQP
jgi:hypothetical protein